MAHFWHFSECLVLGNICEFPCACVMITLIWRWIANKCYLPSAKWHCQTLWL